VAIHMSHMFHQNAFLSKSDRHKAVEKVRVTDR